MRDEGGGGRSGWSRGVGGMKERGMCKGGERLEVRRTRTAPPQLEREF